jgi:hypothetical protein
MKAILNATEILEAFVNICCMSLEVLKSCYFVRSFCNVVSVMFS